MNPNFEGYKLSLDKIQSAKIDLEHPVATFVTKENEISFLSYALFAQYVPLFINRWNNDIYWFSQKADKSYQLVSIAANTPTPEVILELDIDNDHVLPTVHFPSKQSFLLSYGDGRICLYLNGDIIFKTILPNVSDNIESVLINDVQIDTKDDKMYLAATYVRPGEKTKSAIVSFYNYDLQTSTLICLDEFEGGAIPGFVSISSDFSITIAADKLFRHECDNRAENEPNKSSFRWRQNLADLTLFVDFEKKLVKSEVEVVIKQSNISVNVREIEIVGELFQQIDPEESSWVISPGGLEITLQKKFGRGWSQVFKDIDDGEEIFNADFVAQVHQKLGHMTSEHAMPEEAAKPSVDSNQYEECDRVSEFERIVFRFQNGDWTHKASLSANQILFWTYPSPNEKCLATRNDVDACLWTAENATPKNPMTHIATFDALGYIHAGKTGIAFVQSPPDHSYSILVDHKKQHDRNGRAMIYRKSCSLNSTLRNRTSGKRIESIGRQQLINLDTDGPFLGVQCTNESVFLLEKNRIWKLLLKTEEVE